MAATLETMTMRFLRLGKSSKSRVEVVSGKAAFRWLWIPALVLTGCASDSLIPVGLYGPVGSQGIEHCESSGHCVIHTESGLTHVSIGEQSAVVVSFAGRGGDLSTHLDYLITIRNLSDSELAFDPSAIDGYDPHALLEQVREREKVQGVLVGLMSVQAILGGSPDLASLQMLSDSNEDDREVAVSAFADQKLVAQTIAPGSEVGGRIVIRKSVVIGDRISLSIPIGSDVHTVSFAKRERVLPRDVEKRRRASIPSDFSFDGRWVVSYTTFAGNTGMYICNLRTEGSRVHEECDTGGTNSGKIRDGVAALEDHPDGSVGRDLVPVDQNTLKFKDSWGMGVYERM